MFSTSISPLDITGFLLCLLSNILVAYWSKSIFSEQFLTIAGHILCIF